MPVIWCTCWLIYLQTGDYEAAAKANERGAEVDRNYIKSTGATGIYPLMYYSHDLHYLAMARMAQGRFEEARKAADQVAANVAPALKDMLMLEPFAQIPLLFCRASTVGRGTEAAQARSEADDVAGVLALLRGLAFAATGDAKSATGEQAAFEEARKRVPAEAMFSLSSAESAFKVADAVLAAGIAAAGGDRADSIVHLKKAVEAQDVLAYNEPPDWYYPVRESLGAALLKRADRRQRRKRFSAPT